MWKQLGVLEENANTLGLTSTFAELAVDDIDGLRRESLRTVLLAQNNERLDLLPDGKEDEAGVRASDFTRAACWALTQDPYELAASSLSQTATRTAPQANIFSNPERAAGFREWARFFGLATEFKGGLLMNPTFALTSRIGDLLSPGKQIDIGTFFAKAASVFPILDRGEHWARYLRAVGVQERPLADKEVSPALSLALLQMKHEGMLSFENLSDSAARMTLLGRGFRPLVQVTHLTRGGR